MAQAIQSGVIPSEKVNVFCISNQPAPQNRLLANKLHRKYPSIDGVLYFLEDDDLQVAHGYGVVHFDGTPLPFLKKFPSHTSIPSVFVANEERVLTGVHVSNDYRERLGPNEMIAMLSTSHRSGDAMDRYEEEDRDCST